MDMTQSIAPRSDQINADDLMAGPVTVTVKDVTDGAAEQPFDFHLVEFPGRAYRPSKSMRRVIVMAWGKETDAYTGRRLTLFRNPDITFGREKVGGIEIAAISHIDKPLSLALTRTRGKRAPFVATPLATPTAPPARDWLAEMKLITDTGELTELYNRMKATPGAYTDALYEAFGVRGAEIKAKAAESGAEG